MECKPDYKTFKKLIFKKLLTESEINYLVTNFKPSCGYYSDSSDDSSQQDTDSEEEVDQNVGKGVAEPKHEDKPSDESAVERDVCDICNKTFKAKNYLKLHKESVHLKIRKFKCNEKDCGKSFTQKGNLVRHKAVRHPMNYKCHVQFCGKAFTTKRGLDFHFRLKHSKKSSFFRKLSLKKEIILNISQCL